MARRIAIKADAVDVSSGAAWLAAGVATALALVSVWGAAGGTWRRLNEGYKTFSAYSDTERWQAPSNQAGFTFLADFFDLAATSVVRGDRIYFQVPPSVYGTLNLHDTVAALGRFSLLPAVEVTDLEDATVVLSYQADPADLERVFLSQRQFGPAFISRLAEP